LQRCRNFDFAKRSIWTWPGWEGQVRLICLSEENKCSKFWQLDAFGPGVCMTAGKKTACKRQLTFGNWHKDVAVYIFTQWNILQKRAVIPYRNHM
jgi:hypothetical protein